MTTQFNQSNQDRINAIRESIPFPVEVTLHEQLLQVRFQTELMSDKQLNQVGIVGEMLGSLRFSIIAPLAIALGATDVYVALADEIVTCNLSSFLYYKGEHDRRVAAR
jgi:hypothetical protein